MHCELPFGVLVIGLEISGDLSSGERVRGVGEFDGHKDKVQGFISLEIRVSGYGSYMRGMVAE